MKILYLANLRLPTEKAYGIQIAKMCEAFALQGIDLELVYPHRKNPKIKSDIFNFYSVRKNFVTKKIWTPDFYLPGKLDQVSFYVKSGVSAIVLVAYALASDADVIYSRDELPLFLLSFLRRKLVFEAHRFSEKRNFFYSRLRKMKIVTITDSLRKEFIKRGIRSKNVVVARDAVDLDLFNMDIKKDEARRAVGLPAERKIAIYCGHLFEWKGADILARASELMEDVLFVFVGGTDDDMQKFKTKFKERENILILEQKPHKDIPVFLKAADVLILPNSAKEEISRSYTSPLKLFEYMASGRPIVAAALPSIKEILNNNNAILFEPDDEKQLADSIANALSNQLLARDISERAFIDVQKYTWHKRAKMIVDFLSLI